MSFRNELPKYVLVGIWLFINAYLFISTFLLYDDTKKYFYLKFLIKGGLPFARGAASVLQFNCMLVLLPVCRNLLSFIKDIPCLPRGFARVLDKNITFHKMIAYVICLATFLHGGAHIYNFEYLISSWKSDNVIVGYLNMYDDIVNITQLNPIRKAGLDPIVELLKTTAGFTGVIITLVLIIMVSSSTDLIRRSYYEVFWFTHHLFVIFYIGLICHGLSGLLRYQDNVEQHDPVKCSNQTAWSKKVCPIPPYFTKNTAEAWKWVIAPLIIYLIEKLIRFYRSFQPCRIKKIVKHPSNVIEIQMTKPGFSAEPGQYIFLQSSDLSKLEWHPFTLTSCPEEDFFSVHIRVAGDWTERLAKTCEKAEEDGQLCALNLACDGPFGTASSDVFRYKTIMCVGAGIGVTPFASILKNIWYRQQTNNLNKVKKVYFYWICPETSAFEWFADLLQSLETQMIEMGLSDFLEYNIYLTRGWAASDMWNIALHDNEKGDVITGLTQKTKFGRPEWDKVFSRVCSDHKGTNVGVFFCGPAGLSHELHKYSNKYSDAETKFFYNKENF